MKGKHTICFFALLVVPAHCQISIFLDLFPTREDIAVLFGCNRNPLPPTLAPTAYIEPPPEIIWTSASTIVEESSPYEVGIPLSLNNDGSRLVIGGGAKLFVYESFTSDTDGSTGWVMGRDLSVFFSSWVGAVDITSDGNFLVASNTQTNLTTGEIDTTFNGEVKTFKLLTSNDWEQDGATILSDKGASDGFGASLAISEDGLKIAVGAPHGNYVQIVYPVIGSEWKIEFDAPDENSFFGASLSLAGDGNTLAVGAPHTNDYKGAVHIIDIDKKIVKQIFYGKTAGGAGVGDNFGMTLTLSNDASTLAIGSTGGPSSSSYAQVFRYNTVEEKYLQTGNTITGTGFKTFGWPLSLSSDGNTLAVGMPYNDDEGEDSGKTVIYSVNGDLLTQNEFFSGSKPQDHFGSSVSISGNGKFVAVGADENVHVWESFVL